MTTDELKAQILLIAQSDPDFFRELIGSVIKENLHIREQERDFYAPRDSHVNPCLSWGESPREADTFSYA